MSDNSEDGPPPPPPRGYPPPVQGYPPPVQGYPPPGQRYPPPGQRYPAPGQGYPPPGQGYPAPGQGYPPPGQGYPAPGQGYPPPGQGSPTPGQGYPQQYPGHPGGPTGYPSPDQGPTGYSGLAIASLVTAVVLPIIGLVVAIPLGIVALVKMRGTRLKGRWMAIAGIVLPVAWLVGFGVLGAYLDSQQADRDASGQITTAGVLQFGEVREGDCLSLPSPQDKQVSLNLNDLQGVPCADDHNAEAVLVVPIDGDSYPGKTDFDQAAQQPCHDAVAQATGNDTDFLAFRLRPEENVWKDDGGHRVLCFAIRKDGGSIDDLPNN